jgi:glycosyltransferase involved in cell wall biosynthesis
MYPPQSFGGYEIVWRAAVEHLRRRGHEVRVLTTWPRSASVRDGAGVHRELAWYWRDHEFPKLGPAALVRLERRNATVLDRHLAELRPDVVSWWSMGGMSLSLLERVRRAGLPAVAFVHDDWLRYGPHVDHWLRSFAGRKALLGPIAERMTGVPAKLDLAGAARYVFVSETTRRRALEAVPDLADTAVAHSGIDPSFIDPARPGPWRWRLLYVGRIDERKGIGTIVDALAHLPPEAELTIVGAWDDSYERGLAERAQRLGVAGRVHFAGQLDSAELPARYAAADAVVFPVRWEEPWGLVPLEAMARGRPVVATGRGGSSEYLRDGDNCLVFEAGDAAALATAVHRLAAEPDLRERLVAGGLRTVPGHTERQFNEAVEQHLTACAG